VIGKALYSRFVFAEDGQDLIEYGLLAGIIGISAVLIMPAIQTKMGSAFGSWGTGVWNAWIPGPPAP